MLPAHWPLVLDVGTVLVSVSRLIYAGFVYFHYIRRRAVLENTHGKDSGAFRWGLFYSHHHGPYFYYTKESESLNFFDYKATHHAITTWYYIACRPHLNMSTPDVVYGWRYHIHSVWFRSECWLVAVWVLVYDTMVWYDADQLGAVVFVVERCEHVAMPNPFYIKGSMWEWFRGLCLS